MQLRANGRSLGRCQAPCAAVPLFRVPRRRALQAARAPVVVRASASPGPPPSGASPQQQAQQTQTQQQKQAAAGHVANVVSTPAGDVALGSFLSAQPDALEAVREAVSAIRGRLGGEGAFEPELALVFATAAYGGGLEEVVPALRQLVPSLRHVFGCTSFGAIGSTPDAPGDVEGVGGISITLASLPGLEVSITHTLRSAIPDEDASPEAWSELVGLTPGSQLPTSFLVLADPKFQQTRPLLAGLDFAFPAATKVGGVISSGQRYKRRAMYAWSADAPVQAGSKRRQQLLQQRRAEQQRRGEQQRQQQQRGEGGGGVGPGARRAEPAACGPQQQQQKRQEGRDEEQRQQRQQQQQDKGFFGSLFRKLTSGFSEEAPSSSGSSSRDRSSDGASSSSSSSGGSGSGGNGSGAPGQQERRPRLLPARLQGEEDDEWGEDSGMHMYGAAVLALRGNVYLDPITSQGYRAVSDKSWVVGRVSRDGAVVYTLVDPSAPPDDEDGGEVPPLLALCDLLEAGGLGGRDGDLSEADIEELSDDKVWVAIAPDSLAADKDIAPDDFQMMKLMDFDENYGAICVDGQVRTGYRLKLVLRDPEGIRADLAAKLLRLKREDLAAVLAGRPRDPAVGALLFVDLERGAGLHGEAGYEACQVGAFLPVPLAGMFAAAEVSTVNRKAALYELATVAAVLRVAPAPAGGQPAAGDEGGAAEQQQSNEP